MVVKYYKEPQEARPQMPHLLIPSLLDYLSNPLTGRSAHAWPHQSMHHTEAASMTVQNHN